MKCNILSMTQENGGYGRTIYYGIQSPKTKLWILIDSRFFLIYKDPSIFREWELVYTEDDTYIESIETVITMEALKHMYNNRSSPCFDFAKFRYYLDKLKLGELI